MSAKSRWANPGSSSWRTEALTPTASRCSGDSGGPARQLRARLVEDVPAEHLDRAAVLGHRDEHVGRDRPEVRVVPAQQRLDTAHLSRGQVHDRLVDHEELRQVGLRDLLLELHLLGRVVTLGARDQHDPALVAGLRLVERDVRVGQQRLGALVVRVVGEDDADAGAHVEAAAAHRDRLLDGLDQPVGDGPQVSGRAVHEVGELVAAEPRDGVAAAHQAGQPLADHGQDHVPGGVTVPVVDHLEVVEVEQEQAERPVAAGPAPPRCAPSAGPGSAAR